MAPHLARPWCDAPGRRAFSYATPAASSSASASVEKGLRPYVYTTTGCARTVRSMSARACAWEAGALACGGARAGLDGTGERRRLRPGRVVHAERRSLQRVERAEDRRECAHRLARRLERAAAARRRLRGRGVAQPQRVARRRLTDVPAREVWRRRWRRKRRWKRRWGWGRQVAGARCEEAERPWHRLRVGEHALALVRVQRLLPGGRSGGDQRMASLPLGGAGRRVRSPSRGPPTGLL